MPALQLEPGQLSHEIELRRPDVTVRGAEELSLPALLEVKVVRDDALGKYVVGIYQDVPGL